MTVKRKIFSIFAKIMVFCVAMTGIFYTAHADDLCKNLSNITTNISATASGTTTTIYTGIFVPANTQFVENTRYTISMDVVMSNITSSNNGSLLGFYVDYTDGTRSVFQITSYDESGRLSWTTTTGKTVSSIYHFVRNARWTGGTITVSNIQVEKGSTATAYQPYNPLCATCNGTVKIGKWNQLMNGTKKASWTSWQRITNQIDNIADNSVSFDFVGGNQWNLANNYAEGVTVSGHKYFVTTLVTPDIDLAAFDLAYVETGHYSKSFKRVSLQANQQTRVSGITTGTGRGIGFEFRSVDPGHMTIKDFQIFDLTAMFGAGNEPTTVEAAETAIAQRASELGISATNGYYEYYAGENFSYCAPAIKIATNAYNDAQFSPVVANLNSAVATIKSVVSNTIIQTAAIAQIASDKQTRPDSECPAGKTCLLVEDADGTPHWYEIIEEYIPPEPDEPTPASP